MRKFLIATAAAAAMTAGTAQAASYGVSDSIGFSPTELGGTLSVAKFNAALGTLTAMTWEVTASVESTIDMENTGAQPDTFSAETQVQFNLTNLSPGPVLWDLALVGGTIQVNAATGDVDLDPSESTSIDVSNSDGASGGLPFPPDVLGDLSLWQGPGTNGFDVLTSTGLLLTGGGGNLTASQVTNAKIALDVTYTFDRNPPSDVPLPAALPLLASAFGLFGVMRVRKSRKS